MAETEQGAVRRIYTVGHSNHPLDHFITLLGEHAIEVLVDVRSQPYSRYATQFERRSLEAAIMGAGIKYLFLGRELGGRPDDIKFYDDDGRVKYEQVAQSPLFLQGIARLETGIARYRVALLCSEENPAGCHRRLLVGRVLAERGIEVLHIRGDGRVESEEEVRSAEEAQGAGTQLALFPDEEVREWRSIRSVSPRSRPQTSLEP